MPTELFTTVNNKNESCYYVRGVNKKLLLE